MTQDAVGARRRRIGLIAAAAVVIVGVVATTAAIALNQPRTDAAAAPSSTPTETPTPTPTPTPLTPQERLLASTANPEACAVSFAGDGITDAPMLEFSDQLVAYLPIPQRDGLVFAGWYPTPEDAAAFTTAARINGSDMLECTDQQITLYGSWMTPDRNAAEKAQIPILMYHQFTTNPAGESGPLRGNYAYIGDFEAHLQYIADGGFYLPTWDELNAFIDGRLFLPNHSVIVTDDDADHTWLELAAPLVEKHKVLTTSFVITVWRSEPTPNPYVLQRSHTHDMHRAGANGKGLMVNLPADQVAADLETSAQILGAKEIVAYPFGDHNAAAEQGVAEAGYEMARTTEFGYVHIGSDKLALPTVRIDYGMRVDTLPKLIG